MSTVNARLLQIIAELKNDHQKLVEIHEDYRANATKLGELYESLLKQAENRMFTTISNIMKTKHDTAYGYAHRC